MHVVIPDDYQDAVRKLDCFSRLDGHQVTILNDSIKGQNALAESFGDADALVLIRERTKITSDLLVRLPKLRLISQTGKGTSHIDVAACTGRGIVVCAGSGSPYAPAELTWALVLAAMRRIPAEVNSLRAGEWQRAPIGRTVRGRTLGIWGYGKIGKLVAGYGRAMGMNVMVWGREGSLTRAEGDGVTVASSKEMMFEHADVLSLHLRLDGETTAIVQSSDLARMKRDALLVNTSRAELIAPGALEIALRQGRPGFAAVDVYEDEPALNHPLLSLPNALCTPHLGYVEEDSYELYFGQAFDQVVAFVVGKPINVVNRELFAPGASTTTNG